MVSRKVDSPETLVIFTLIVFTLYSNARGKLNRREQIGMRKACFWARGKPDTW